MKNVAFYTASPERLRGSSPGLQVFTSYQDHFRKEFTSQSLRNVESKIREKKCAGLGEGEYKTNFRIVIANSNIERFNQKRM